jgi:hypothetical protein
MNLNDRIGQAHLLQINLALLCRSTTDRLTTPEAP